MTSGASISTKRDPAIRSTGWVLFRVVWFPAFKFFAFIKDLEIISVLNLKPASPKGAFDSDLFRVFF